MIDLLAQSASQPGNLIQQAKAGGWYAWLLVGAVLVVIVLGFAAFKLRTLLDRR